MQHGEATAEADDPARPLTDAGRATVAQVAARARSAGVRIDTCVHSGKLRAEQTARVLADAVAGGRVEPRDGLAPNDPVGPVVRWLGERTGEPSIALVGHLPLLDRLASSLITGEEDGQVISFQMGGLVKLVPKGEQAGWAVAWLLAPDVA